MNNDRKGKRLQNGDREKRVQKVFIRESNVTEKNLDESDGRN